MVDVIKEQDCILFILIKTKVSSMSQRLQVQIWLKQEFVLCFIIIFLTALVASEYHSEDQNE